MNTPELIMLIGLPASGKSFWLKENVPDEDAYIASTDDFIEKKAKELGITYDQAFHDYIKEATKEMHEGIRHAVKHDKNIYWDQTNLTVNSRRKKLSTIPNKYLKKAIYFVVDEDVLSERLHRRAIKEGKSIPERLIKNMSDSYVHPTLDEGFDVIIKKEI